MATVADTGFVVGLAILTDDWHAECLSIYREQKKNLFTSDGLGGSRLSSYTGRGQPSYIKGYSLSYLLIDGRYSPLFILLSKANRKCPCNFRILTLVLEEVKLLTHIERVRNGTYISFHKMDLSIVGDFFRK